ncbi:hypothetical protein SCP_0309170 [Sparassis crispa]|uniref:Uncharacterized protein n=1 Tax=Sparassis crispa TaxID=139825 RepID=A0A401GG82_9APHY|nr:hypothetical protein SCP_0309170 [Sparassis crispa]GBE81190.1 hypothetical protein SCP_0309170 [Sparassis crispa]
MPVPALPKKDTFWHLCPDEEDEEEEDEEDEVEVEVEETNKRDQGNVESDDMSVADKDLAIAEGNEKGGSDGNEDDEEDISKDNISPDMVVPIAYLEEIRSTEVTPSSSAFSNVLVPEMRANTNAVHC